MSDLPQRLYLALRPLLFRLPPETAHGLGIQALRLAAALAPPQIPPGDPSGPLSQALWGRIFRNPVGLAAGFDKDARAVGALPLLGFGFGEVGTVTPEPQAGNPRPRLFRHPAAESLRNAMGFNNAGARALRHRLVRRHARPVPLGVNIGKNRDTPDERAEDDYGRLFDTFAELCDYFVVNVSSPNTPGLRGLQNRRFLARVLGLGRELTERPVLVKLSPDMEAARAAELGVAALESGAAGLVLTNTTTDYTLVPGAGPPGGLSGACLAARSRALLAVVARAVAGRDAVLVSVGGIADGDEAYTRLRLGASLVQIYTGLVYRGPGLPRAIVRRLAVRLERDGAERLEAVIGADL